MNLIEKLQKIQSELKAPKGQYNSFGKYNYRSCEDILEGVKPLLTETKTALTIADEIVEIGGRVYVKATATLHDGESEQTISNTAYAREEESKKGMDASQVTGATSSYARKYCLNGLLCIDDTKDADTMDNRQKEEQPQDKPINKIMVDTLVAMAKKKGVSEEKICSRYGKKKFADLMVSNYADAMKGLEKMEDKKVDLGLE